jgi:hypothetical protein
VHKVARVEEAIESAGATGAYLPKYSADLNRIELAFSKLKAHLRKAAEHTISRLMRRIGRVVAGSARENAATSSAMRLRSNLTGIRSRSASFVNDPNHWRLRAEEMRTLAERDTKPQRRRCSTPQTNTAIA